MSPHDLRAEALAAARLIERLRETMEVGEEEAELVVASETNLAEAASATLRRMGEIEAQIAALGDLIERYQTRRTTLRDRLAALRDGLLSAMATAGIRTLRLPEATLSQSMGKPAVRILDESAIPGSFMRVRVEQKPDLAAIAEALKSGKAVEGAVLANGNPILTVRR